ncbi:unnamed protein product [Pieris macdunnoughi]|uniref:SCP domain-containing protein n=1 Tax=Pieris macdunnoughi TaxID=345717 RepID=A0A821PXY9_9NEOP|nr:unnamed protein product [Pieris macdunnoughi]
MCKYTVSKPHHRCTGFEHNLTDNDIKEIVDRINEKRNYVAMGYLRGFPQAANMKKITWSSELAEIAQRWANQCDPSIMPDKEDECRDLEGTKVGQNIATVTGVTNELNVKNFIDIWFMESLAFRGNVVYYNSSENNKCNNFVQLIWAPTSNVGCGRAAFHIRMNGIRRRVDRLVCNFMPKGNINRRPIYTIGLPATQCVERLEPDKMYPGLCSPDNELTTPTSLLINPVTSEIDPIRHHHNDMVKDLISGQNTENSKKDYVLKRDNKEVRWSPPNAGRTESHIIQRERGHSRIYHSHDHTDEFDYLHPDQSQFRKFDTASPIPEYYSTGFYRRNRVQQCTRKSDTKISNDYVSPTCWSSFSPLKLCTRGQNNNCAAYDQKIDTTTKQFFCQNTQNLCQCQSLTSVHLSPCLQNNNCECITAGQHSNNCPMRRNLEEHRPSKILIDEYKKPYDKYVANDYSLFDTPKTELKFKDNEFPKSDVPTRFLLRKSKKLLDSSERKRRGDITFKPFWQEDEFDKKQHQLKSIRYTTLGYTKRTRKRKPIKSSNTQNLVKVTEPITISMNVSHKKFATEKFLSFDELLRLRKLNTADINARRADESAPPQSEETATQTESSTSEYTANTPFIRLKHCTRKLTCTWTAASLGDNEGNADVGNRGSRTPPGYVEGCTRTSTCTRDFMNRNKMDTIPTPSAEPEIEDGSDEDYCEKRSLNVRRDSKLQEILNVSPYTILPFVQNKDKDLAESKHESIESETCECENDYLRNKKITSEQKFIKKRESESYGSLSYGDLFYLVVNKLMKNWNLNKKIQSDKCSFFEQVVVEVV